jgi:hypothetical protein
MSRRNSSGRNLKQTFTARATRPAIVTFQFEAPFFKFTFLKLTKVAIAEKLHCGLKPTSDQKGRQITKINSLPQPQLTPRSYAYTIYIYDLWLTHSQLPTMNQCSCQLRFETHIHGMLKRCHL